MDLIVREMDLSETAVRIDYFHSASDEHLATLGVDRARLPTREAWQAFYEADYDRPLAERENYTLAWVLDDEIIGFSSTDQIAFGQQAFMHLHIVKPDRRQSGLGTECVRRSVALYFETLELRRLFCQPNAFNTAPNRTLQRVGFRYVHTREMQPSPINFPQPVTRWMLSAEELARVKTTG